MSEQELKLIVEVVGFRWRITDKTNHRMQQGEGFVQLADAVHGFAQAAALDAIRNRDTRAKQEKES